MSINDNITLGAFNFPLNPENYDIDFIKPSKSRRTLNNTLIVHQIVDSNDPTNTKLKRKITMSGITEDELNGIQAEFKKAGFIQLIDIYNETITVYFADFRKRVDNKTPTVPTYNIVLEEV